MLAHESGTDASPTKTVTEPASLMACTYCGVAKLWPAAFPNRLYAECWQCVWDQHLRDEHPPKRRWHVRWPFYRSPSSEEGAQ